MLIRNKTLIVSVIGVLIFPFLVFSFFNYFLSPNPSAYSNTKGAHQGQEKIQETKNASILSSPKEGESEYVACKTYAEQNTTGFALVLANWGCWSQRWITDPIALFTSYIVGVTGILAFYTFRLWSAGEDTAKKELRAYLGATNGKIYFLPGNVLRAEVELTNSGKTPAHKVTPTIYGEIRAPGDNKIFKDTQLIPHRAPIAPGSHWTIGHEFRGPSGQGLSDTEMQEVLADKKLIFVWGRAEYEDIFEKPQELRFRFRNVVKSLRIVGGKAEGIEFWWLYPEEDGNEAK